MLSGPIRDPERRVAGTRRFQRRLVTVKAAGTGTRLTRRLMLALQQGASFDEPVRRNDMDVYLLSVVSRTGVLQIIDDSWDAICLK